MLKEIILHFSLQILQAMKNDYIWMIFMVFDYIFPVQKSKLKIPINQSVVTIYIREMELASLKVFFNLMWPRILLSLKINEGVLKVIFYIKDQV